MFGTNKEGVIDRIGSSGDYEELIPQYKFRSEPKKYSEKEYMTKAMHVTHKVFGKITEIQSGDRLTTEDRVLVIAGVATFDDQLGKHMEMLAREIGSVYHEEVTVRSESETQTTYDPIFQEWASGKDWDESTLSVLIDPVAGAKESFISIIDSGKLEGTEYIMTVDLPYTLDSNMKIVYGGTEYDIKWEVKSPFQVLVGLTKSIGNY